MNAELKRLDQKSDVLFSLYQAGRISEAVYTARLRKLVARCEVIFARQAAKAA